MTQCESALWAPPDPVPLTRPAQDSSGWVRHFHLPVGTLKPGEKLQLPGVTQAVILGVRPESRTEGRGQSPLHLFITPDPWTRPEKRWMSRSLCWTQSAHPGYALEGDERCFYGTSGPSRTWEPGGTASMLRTQGS